MTTIKLYNAFPPLSLRKKTELIKFLSDYPENRELNSSTLVHLIDYALKEIHSFGGFIVTEEKDKEIIGAMVVNNTGMHGYMPNNLIVASAFVPGLLKTGSKKRLIQKIMYITKGDTAYLINNDIEKEVLPKNLGVKTIQYR